MVAAHVITLQPFNVIIIGAANMAYIRKTRDEWEIQGNYGQGWECVNTETSQQDAKRSLGEYRSNEPYLFKVVKKRVKIEA